MSGMDWRNNAGDRDGRVDSIEQHGNRVVVAFSWSERNGTRHDWAQVLQVSDGKIVSIQDYASPSRAGFTTKLRALVTA
jgi:hypothetical protein